MKARIQTMIGLVFIAIIISMIAVSFAWYSAEAGEVTFSGTSVTITTAENNYGGGSAILTASNVLTKNGETYTAANLEPYRGQKGLEDEAYILLFVSDTPIMGSNPHVSNCTVVNTAKLLQEEYMYDLDDSTAEVGKPPFTVIPLADNGDGTYSAAIDSDSYTLFAVVFGDGENVFPFSDIKYLGINFNLNIMLDIEE